MLPVFPSFAREGAIHCWGRADKGQLGHLPATDLLTPTPLLEPAPREPR